MQLLYMTGVGYLRCTDPLKRALIVSPFQKTKQGLGKPFAILLWAKKRLGSILIMSGPLGL